MIDLVELSDLMPLINDAKQLLIICEESDGEALAALAMNASNGSFKSCIIKIFYSVAVAIIKFK